MIVARILVQKLISFKKKKITIVANQYIFRFVQSLNKKSFFLHKNCVMRVIICICFNLSEKFNRYNNKIHHDLLLQLQTENVFIYLKTSKTSKP